MPVSVRPYRSTIRWPVRRVNCSCVVVGSGAEPDVKSRIPAARSRSRSSTPSIRWYIVGTAMRRVASARAATVCVASKRSWNRTRHPASSAVWRATNSPWTWKIGSTWISTSVSVIRQRATRSRPFAVRPSAVAGAPLGRPVVPDVYSIVAGSPPTAEVSGGASLPSAALERREAKGSVGHPGAASPVSSPTYRAGSASTTTCLTSPAVYSGFSGTGIAPMRNAAMWVANASVLLPVWTTSRSPGPTPLAARAPASASLRRWKAWNVRVVPSGSTRKTRVLSRVCSVSDR